MVKQYFEILGLKKEPFSTTPEPSFYYESKEHKECLVRLEISLRLKRGLSVVLGGIGTGKSTLSRLLLRNFFQTINDYEFYLILDPTWDSEYEFLKYLLKLFNIHEDAASSTECKNILKHFLFEKGVEQGKTIALVIDEGQKLTAPFLEILRTLLNYETSEHKLLQLVIFAQPEFLDTINEHPNFKDRISTGYMLNPLNKMDSVRLIEHRIMRAGGDKERKFFTIDAYELIYYYTQGYPRKIMTICHDAFIEMIREDKAMVDEEIINNLIRSSQFLYV